MDGLSSRLIDEVPALALFAITLIVVLRLGLAGMKQLMAEHHERSARYLELLAEKSDEWRASQDRATDVIQQVSETIGENTRVLAEVVRQLELVRGRS